MEITIRHIEDCPNVDKAEERVRRALQASGNDGVAVRREVVHTLPEAERLRFVGSPTILIDGSDPFADSSAPVALACRVYGSPEGSDGAPSLEQLERAIRQS